MQPIIVINPNSSQGVTAAMAAALHALQFAGGPSIECLTLAEGPPGIESQQHVEAVVQPLCRLIQAHEADAGAFVIACFSDPGLHLAREVSARPVLGIAESGILTALTLGERFGIIAILPQSLPRHLRYIRSLGVGDRFAADLPVNLPVVELADSEKVLHRMIAVGAQLRDQHGADVIVMGCAGMAQYRAPLQDALGIPVVEPTQAAVTMALGRVALGG
jgi:Asp/Glu/hydantoin racemase